MSSVHHVYPRFLCRSAVTVWCAGAPAPPGRKRSLVVAALIALTVTACGDVPGPAESTVDRALRLEGSAATLDILGEAVVESVVRGDTAALAGFRLTEEQHNRVVWPELPVSAPEVGFPVDFAWQNIETRNRSALLRTLPAYRDRDLDFRRVECRGEAERFETFEVLTDCWLVFADEGRSGTWEVQAFKDILLRGGGYKIFRYYDGEPRRHGGPSIP